MIEIYLSAVVFCTKFVVVVAFNVTLTLQECLDTHIVIFVVTKYLMANNANRFMFNVPLFYLK